MEVIALIDTKLSFPVHKAFSLAGAFPLPQFCYFAEIEVGFINVDNYSLILPPFVQLLHYLDSSILVLLRVSSRISL